MQPLIIPLVFYVFIGKCHSAYIIDDAEGTGRVYDGIGGISGGGATSKLLVNYPAQQRDEILDYLFQPNFGASLQILKVEIGGDSQSTDGTESSHMHEPWDENYHRGYEWWLMVEAKKRNPAIKLYGLPWAYPGWLADKKGSPYGNPERTADYVLKWVQGAKTHYGLDIDYIGLRDERPYSARYVKVLRSRLDAHGLDSVTIVAADDAWDISDDMLRDSSLANAVGIVGVHYPGTNTTVAALATGKKLWSSEDYSTFNDNVGAGCWARILNQNYVNGFMTSTISWTVIASYYNALPFGRDGLMTAVQPWSGHYTVSSPIWVTAHTTQFTDVGWRYLRHGAGVGHLDGGGSYVTLQCPRHGHVTLVIETMSHNHSECIRPELPQYDVRPQTAVFTLKGTMRNVSKLAVWYSKLGFDGSSTTMMKRLPSITVQRGTFSLHLDVDVIYTLTTAMGRGSKGTFKAPPPSSKPFPLPYTDDFEDYPEFSEAANFVPQVGVWEVRKSGDAGHGKVNRQVILHQPVDWCVNRIPINIGGNSSWSDIRLSVDVSLPTLNHTEGVTLAARVNDSGCQSDNASGVFFTVFLSDGTFRLAADARGHKVITSGKLPQPLQPDVWYNITLVVMGRRAIGLLDSEKVFDHNVRPTPSQGFVGYGVTNFGLADFDNFKITETMNNIPLLPKSDYLKFAKKGRGANLIDRYDTDIQL